MRPPLCLCDVRGCIAFCTCTEHDKEVWEALQAQAEDICRLATERIAELQRETHATGETSAEYKAIARARAKREARAQLLAAQSAARARQDAEESTYKAKVQALAAAQRAEVLAKVKAIQERLASPAHVPATADTISHRGVIAGQNGAGGSYARSGPSSFRFMRARDNDDEAR